MPDPYVLVDPGAIEPPGRQYWTTPEMAPPLFATHVVATVFFARTVAWLKDHLNRGHSITAEGDVRPQKALNGHYAWRLYDIERFAHALAQQGLINGRRAELVVQLVRTTARLYEHQT
jgi:hypothetical protein